MDREEQDLSAMSFEWLVERLGASLAALRSSSVDPRQGPVADLRRNICAIREAARREDIREDSALRAADELEGELAASVSRSNIVAIHEAARSEGVRHDPGRCVACEELVKLFADPAH